VPQGFTDEWADKMLFGACEAIVRCLSGAYPVKMRLRCGETRRSEFHIAPHIRPATLAHNCTGSLLRDQYEIQILVCMNGLTELANTPKNC
jgi:hypothetical protein